MEDVILASELQAGRYVCLKTGSVFGAVIRLFTGSRFDHVAVVTGPGQITQATIRGVRTTPLSGFRGALAVANSAEEMTERQREAVVTFALAADGDEYGWKDIALLGLRRLGVRWAWLLRLATDRDAMICSELAAAAGVCAGLPGWLCGYSSAMLVKPSDLATRRVMVPVAWDGSAR